MKRLALGLLALTSLAASVAPAAAQYYPYPAPPRYYEERPGRFYRPDPYGERFYRRPVEFGNICFTSRGSCRTRPQPLDAPCRCDIPGFGLKRGGVVSGGW